MVLRTLPIPGLGPVAPRTVLEIDLSAGVAFGPPRTPLDALRLRQAPTLRGLAEGLRRGAEDDGVLGLLVHVGTCPLSLAQADEVGQLVAEFSRHKPSVAWTETFGELTSGLAAYRVAVNAREVWLQPTGGLGLTGVHVGITLLRGALEKLDVEPQFGQRHEFKSAADQLSAREVSGANREMVQRLADSIVDDTVARVAEARGRTPEQVRAAIAAAPLTATAARDAGLVDRLGYRDEVYAWAVQAWTPGWQPRYAQRYAQDGAGSTVRALARRGRPAVAVVDVDGAIGLGPGTSRQAGAERVCARLREVGRDDDVRAVVLRVDSPGGSYVASDSIRREVLRLRDTGRPVVASMGTVAASGGYFVAMGADEVVAQPTTLTGSIGVLAGKLVVERLLARVGVVHEGVDSGPRAAMMAATRPFSDDDWRVLDTWLDEVYADFTAKAAADRGLDLAVLEPLARGRVWTGVDAVERGLVDHLGGTRRALERACALARLDVGDVRLRTPSPLELLRQLRTPESSEAHAASAYAVPGCGPEALLSSLAESVGLPVPHGVLSMPWRLTLG